LRRVDIAFKAIAISISNNESENENVDEHARASACGAVTSHAVEGALSSLRSRFCWNRRPFVIAQLLHWQ
jgi:hypothetical protein